MRCMHECHCKKLEIDCSDIRLAEGRQHQVAHADGLNAMMQSTPVWRAGPLGPKTLCNACGVRYMKVAKRVR